MMFNIVSLVINSALRGCGNTRISMKTNLTGNLINIIGNYLLVQGKFGFPMLGVAGSAIATVIGTVVACIMSISSLFDKNSFISIPYMISEKIGISFDAIKPMMKITLSTFSEQILLRIGFMSVAVMAAKQGTAAFAAHQVGMNIMGLSFSFGDGMQMAAVSLIGQSLGQEKPEMAKKYGSICQAMGVSIAIVLSVLYLVFGRMIFEMFFTEVEIIDIGVTIMKLMVIIVLMQLPQVIFMGCLRGAGDVVFTTIASTISVTILRPLASFVFCYTLGFGIVGLWLGVVADQFVRLALTTWRFSSGVWTKVKL
jgi:putative MATE family efflux protein